MFNTDAKQVIPAGLVKNYSFNQIANKISAKKKILRLKTGKKVAENFDRRADFQPVFLK